MNTSLKNYIKLIVKGVVTEWTQCLNAQSVVQSSNLTSGGIVFRTGRPPREKKSPPPSHPMYIPLKQRKTTYHIIALKITHIKKPEITQNKK